jgi:hypothetical protein
MKSKTKICQNCKKEFVIEPDDFNFYEKIKVPPPTFCYLCRAQRRFAWRNEKKLFKVKDAFTDREIFSLFPTQAQMKVITQEEWHGDSWDGMEYGKNFDFTKTFFEQFFELIKKVPTYNLNTKLLINSPYSGNAVSLKNCYLCFDSDNLENCMYSTGNTFCKDSVDNTNISHCDRCYDSFWLENCYQNYFSILSSNSNNLWFCKDCLGCSYCFGCVNLHKSSYCIFNKKYKKEDYFKKLEDMKLNTRSGIKQAKEKARSFWRINPVKYIQGIKNYHSSGSYISNCKNVSDSFIVMESENLRYCQYMNIGNKDCYDVTIWGKKMELNYESCLPGSNTYNIKFSVDCWSAGKNIEYGFCLLNCSDCFGCVGLKKKQYCILNKQYKKEEYYELVSKIKKHMDNMPYTDKKGIVYKYGEFFPIEFSPFGYNNTIAAEHFPLTKEEALYEGYPWIDVPRGKYQITMDSNDLPNNIEDVDDQINKEVIKCENCENPFRILDSEFVFYKKEKLPVPSLCSDCRHKNRRKDIMKLNLYDRNCMCIGKKDSNHKYENTREHGHGNKPCQIKFKTGYDPKEDAIVYCEECYQQEVY